MKNFKMLLTLTITLLITKNTFADITNVAEMTALLTEKDVLGNWSCQSNTQTQPAELLLARKAQDAKEQNFLDSQLKDIMEDIDDTQQFSDINFISNNVTEDEGELNYYTVHIFSAFDKAASEKNIYTVLAWDDGAVVMKFLSLSEDAKKFVLKVFNPTASQSETLFNCEIN